MIKKLWQQYKVWRRGKDILDACGNICYCPNCKDPLNDQAYMLDDSDGVVTHKCRSCGFVSRWLFDAPVPICLSVKPTGDDRGT